MRTCTYTIAFALSTALASAQTYVTPSPRRSASCAMMDAGKIHCFGGQAGASTTSRIDTSLYTLDTTKVQSDYATHWEEITDSINAEIFTTYPRTRASVAVTSDKKNMLITGGMFGAIDANPARSLVYNMDTKSWRALPNFDDGVNGNDRQIYAEATSWVPDQTRVYIFGGAQAKAAHRWYYDTVLNRNLTNVIYAKDNSSSKIGYYRMTTLDVTTDATTPWQIPPQQNPPVLSYYLQTSVYHPTSKKIFFIGGLVNNATTEEVVNTRNVSMSEIMTFDTVTGAWGTQLFTGDVIPSPRKSHTATLLPSGQDILIPPSRTEHSAVLDESKKIVYILFGYQELRSLANTFNTVLAINVTDPRRVNFIDTSQNLFTAAEKPTPATGDKEIASQTPNPSNDKSSTVGGAVGGSLGGLLVIGIVAFFIWRKKRADKKKRLAKQRQEEEAEQLSVDWDAIEGGFTESCPVPTDEKDQQYSKPFDPSGLSENKQPLVMRDEPSGTTLASLPVPDANANEVLIPDGGACSELMTKPDLPSRQQ
ncbi:hypothetical protein MAM1_0304c09458 [Mucor ambiguus]|uniref:Kelch repeat protein n=1 Tax=Mucor ambiguus TaxID=91626 RepID=A0A0C9LXB9_9FUNG|nr:hypothetical protein MAM1_0304c09458 [Mucor ambiguus]